jgi:hypothetical protein
MELNPWRRAGGGGRYYHDEIIHKVGALSNKGSPQVLCSIDQLKLIVLFCEC